MPAERDPALPDRVEVRRAAERAAGTYDDAAVLQREVGRRMAERLALVKLRPQTILDAGSGTGEALVELTARYPGATIIALDFAPAMVAASERRAAALRASPGGLAAKILRPRSNVRGASAFVCADATRLPIQRNSIDLVWSNLMLPLIAEPAAVFAELLQALRVGGLLMFTTLGPDTLKELRSAFAGIDGATHVGRFIDMHDIGDTLVEAGFAEPVMDAEMITLTYADGTAMMRELKAMGAHNSTLGRPRGMMGRARWTRMLGALEQSRREGQLPATCEVVYGHAWKPEPRFAPDGRAIVHFERLPRR